LKKSMSESKNHELASANSWSHKEQMVRNKNLIARSITGQTDVYKCEEKKMSY